MSKAKKCEKNNQWASQASGSLESCSSCGCKNKKSATDNQWTSTIKNG